MENTPELSSVVLNAIVWGIVLRRHSRAVRMRSKPADTRFHVSLPSRPPMVGTDKLQPVDIERIVA